MSVKRRKFNKNMKSVDKYINEDDYVEALRELMFLEDGAEKTHQLWKIHYMKAFVYFNQDKFETAREEVTQALLLNNKEVYSHSLRGDVNRKLGRYIEAIQDYSNAISLNSTARGKPVVDAGLLSLDRAKRGYCYFKKGQVDDALNDFSVSLGIDKSNDTAYYYRALVDLDIKRLDEAYVNAKQANSIDSENPDYYWVMAEAEFRIGKTYEAYEHIHDAIDKDENKPSYYCTSAEITLSLDKLAETESAIKIGERLECDNETRSRLLLAKTRLFIKKGEKDEARSLLDNLMALSPNNKEGVKLSEEIGS